MSVMWTVVWVILTLWVSRGWARFGAHGGNSDPVDPLLAVGYGNIDGDVEGKATVEYGKVPAWINGEY